MRIVTLAENTEGSRGCGAEHGLSLYIETDRHRILMDTGASDLFLENARLLGVDLSMADIVVISHGHYDHGGGILPFTGMNGHARIYLQEGACGNFYSTSGTLVPHYIGLPEGIEGLGQIELVKGDLKIDDGLFIFSGIGTAHPLSSANADLLVKEAEGFRPDDFEHEQCLVVTEHGKHTVFSGCAHHGILNVLDRFEQLYQAAPDAVVSGFHMMKKEGYSDEDTRQIIETAMELKKYPTRFYTGHCTGEIPYQLMKKIMGSQLVYLHSGDEIRISQ